MSAIKLLMSDQLTFMSTLIGYVEMYQLAFHENYFRTNLLDRDWYLFVTVDSANICVQLSDCTQACIFTGYFAVFLELCIYIGVLFFSDKLYKEIRDLNFEVVVQVHSTDFNFCLFM